MTDRSHSLRLLPAGIDTYSHPVVYMHEECHVCQAEGFRALTRVRIDCGEYRVIATLNVVTDGDWLSPDAAALSDAAWDALQPEEGARGLFSHPDPPAAASVIRAKVYGERLSEAQFRTIMGDTLARRLSDLDLSAFVTACAGGRLDFDETIGLTRAMQAAGETLNWGGKPVLDKHCVGGLPGNRTTPIVVAIVAAAGHLIPKTSSRAITSPAGTADTMEVMTPVAAAFGLELTLQISDGSQPVGQEIGPALEAMDVLRVLRCAPDAPAALRDRALTLARLLLDMGGGSDTGTSRTRELLDSGAPARRGFVAGALGRSGPPRRAAVRNSRRNPRGTGLCAGLCDRPANPVQDRGADMRAVLASFPEMLPLAERLAPLIGAEIAPVGWRHFPNGESQVTLNGDFAGRNVAILCTLRDPDRHALPLRFAAATVRDLDAASVGLIAPYLGYMRQDRRFAPGQAVSAPLFAGFIEESFDWLVTADPHLHRIPSLDRVFTIPANWVVTAPLLAEWITGHVADPVLLGPDSESQQWVAEVANLAGCPYKVLRKQRSGDRSVEISVPDNPVLRAGTPVILDDIASTGRTLVRTIERLREAGTNPPVCVVIHAVFAGNSYADILNAGVRRIVTTDSIPHESNVIEITSLLATATREAMAGLTFQGPEASQSNRTTGRKDQDHE